MKFTDGIFAKFCKLNYDRILKILKFIGFYVSHDEISLWLWNSAAIMR
nr:hypothetical protein [uncultured Campylobacter sp.]